MVSPPGDLPKAQHLLTQALEILMKTFGPEHETVCAVLEQLVAYKVALSQDVMSTYVHPYPLFVCVV